MSKKIEISDSQLAENFRTATDILKKDMDAKAKELEVGSCVRVADMELTPYVLIEAAAGKTWIPFHGESVEQLNKLIEWEDEGRKMMNDAERPANDLEVLRQALICISTLTTILDSREIGQFLMEQTVTRIAELWYNRDHNTKVDLEKMTPDDFPKYFHLVAGYIEKFGSFYGSVMDNTHVMADHVQSELKKQ